MVGGVLKRHVHYNGLEQLAIARPPTMTPSGTTHFIHELDGEHDRRDGGWRGDRRDGHGAGIHLAAGGRDYSTFATRGAGGQAAGGGQCGEHDAGDVVRPCRSLEAPDQDDGRRQSVSVWDAVWQPWGNVHTDDRNGGSRRALPRPMVPARNGLALQLEPELRSHDWKVHPSRSVGSRRWPERVWVCAWKSAELRRSRRVRRYCVLLPSGIYSRRLWGKYQSNNRTLSRSPKASDCSRRNIARHPKRRTMQNTSSYGSTRRLHAQMQIHKQGRAHTLWISVHSMHKLCQRVSLQVRGSKIFVQRPLAQDIFRFSARRPI